MYYYYMPSIRQWLWWRNSLIRAVYIGFTKSEKKKGNRIFYNRSTADASLRQEPGGSLYSPAASVAATGSRKNYWFPFYSIKRRVTPCHVLPPIQLAARQNSSFRNYTFFSLSPAINYTNRYNIQWLMYIAWSTYIGIYLEIEVK